MRLILLFVFPFLSFGQTDRTATPARPNCAELQKFLELSNDQITQLKQLQADRLGIAEAAYRDITAKQKQLTELLTSGSTDALTIGTLSIELQHLRSGIVVPRNEREQSTAILSAPQKMKLAELQQVLALRQAADQAAALHLIDYPRVVVTIQK